MTKKAFFKAVLFLLIITLCVYFSGLVLQPKRVTNQPDTTAKVSGFYNETENSLDVVFCGSSKIFCLINPNQLWQDYGFTSYDFATNEQPIWITYYYIKEVLKYQSPDVIVVDAYMAAFEQETQREAVTRAGLDFLKLSPNKIDAVLDNASLEELPSYIFPFFRYHDRWSSLGEEDFKYMYYNQTNQMRGYSPMYMVTAQNMSYVSSVTQKAELTEKAEEYLLKIIELSKEEDFELLFLNTPYCISEETQKKYNKIAEIAQENDVPFLDCNLHIDEIGLNFETDFIDEVHTNVVGAEKVTKFVGSYIKSNYNLTDKRNDSGYDSWNDSLEYWLSYNEKRLPTLGTAEAEETLQGLLI